tara:strand:+ start:160 stop:378 length:219 start_codon:yes stop_codon:yes gene_type:complete
MYPITPPKTELIKFGNISLFKSGTIDLRIPITIKVIVNSFGIIKCFRSIKNIITKQIVRIKNNKVVIEIPKK